MENNTQKTNKKSKKAMFYEVLAFSLMGLGLFLCLFAGFNLTKCSKNKSSSIPDISEDAKFLYDNALALTNKELDDISKEHITSIVSFNFDSENHLFKLCAANNNNVVIVSYSSDSLTTIDTLYSSWVNKAPDAGDYDCNVVIQNKLVDESFNLDSICIDSQAKYQLSNNVNNYISYTAKLTDDEYCSLTLGDYDLINHKCTSNPISVTYENNIRLFDLYRYIIQ